MSDFSDSLWADEAFSAGYRDQAERFLPERPRLLATLRSHYRAFCRRDDRPTEMLDLGCGDGVVTAALLDVDPGLAATLVDGGEAMLAAARTRLVGNSRFVTATFQALLVDDSLLAGRTFDLVVSSLAVHHLTLAEKQGLFAWCHAHLAPEGHLVLVDVVLAPDPALEEWYLRQWEEAIEQRHPGDRELADIPRQYKANRDNRPDPLLVQLDALARAGFERVDCFYKQGIFAVFGGRRGEG